MRSRRTISRKPLAGRIRVDPTILTRGLFGDPAAAAAFLDNGVTTAPVKSAALLAHEGTILPRFDGLTNHWNHPLVIFYLHEIVRYLKPCSRDISPVFRFTFIRPAIVAGLRSGNRLHVMDSGAVRRGTIEKGAIS